MNDLANNTAAPHLDLDLGRVFDGLTTPGARINTMEHPVQNTQHLANSLEVHAASMTPTTDPVP